MKKFYLALCLLGNVCNLFCAPLYRSGETKVPSNDFYRWEISGDYIYSFMQLEDKYGDTALRGGQAIGLRALYAINPYISVGAEGAYFSAQSFGEFVSKYKQNRAGVVVKFELAPDVSPRVYALLGMGKSRYDFVYRKTPASAYWQNTHTSITYWNAGVGTETDIWKNCFIGIEGNLIYHKSTNLSFYYHLKHRLNFLTRLRAGIRF